MKTLRDIIEKSLPAGRQGFTIFFAMLIASLSLAVGLAIFDLTIRELDLSATATQSQFAIYAADTGADCALYWDFNYSDQDGSAFGTSSASSWPGSGTGVVLCNGQDITVGTPPDPFQLPPTGWDPWDLNNSFSDRATTTFTVAIATTLQTYCATIEVGKYTDGSGILHTTVISRGYNTCETAGVTRLERALQVNY